MAVFIQRSFFDRSRPRNRFVMTIVYLVASRDFPGMKLRLKSTCVEETSLPGTHRRSHSTGSTRSFSPPENHCQLSVQMELTTA